MLLSAVCSAPSGERRQAASEIRIDGVRRLEDGTQPLCRNDVRMQGLLADLERTTTASRLCIALYHIRLYFSPKSHYELNREIVKMWPVFQAKCNHDFMYKNTYMYKNAYIFNEYMGE